MAIKGSLKRGVAPRRAPAARARAEDRLPVDRRPLELRLHLLRSRVGSATRRSSIAATASATSSSKHEKITQEQLDAADRTARAKTRDKKLGEILVEPERALAAGARSATCACRSRSRSTTCSPGRRARSTSKRTSAPSSRTSSSRSTPSRCCSRARARVDEWGLIEKKIPSFDLIFIVDRDRARASATPSSTEVQERLLPLLDGSRDVNQVDRRFGARRIRGRQGAVRTGDGRLPASRRTHRPAPKTPR